LQQKNEYKELLISGYLKENKIKSIIEPPVLGSSNPFTDFRVSQKNRQVSGWLI